MNCFKNGFLGSSVAVLMLACSAPEAGRDSAITELSFTALPTIGEALIGGPGFFGEVTDLELGMDGSVFILDGSGGVVQVFNAEGAYERTIGGRGNGPGELQRAEALFWGLPGQLWVVDPGNGRYTVFDTEGGVVATYRRSDAGIFLPYPGGLGIDGVLYDVTFEFGPEGPVGFWVELEPADGAVREKSRLALPPVGLESFELEAPGLTLVVPVPFSSVLLAQATAGHLWYGETGEPWVYRRSLSDATEHRFGREFDAPPVTEEALRTVLEHADYEELQREASEVAYGEFLERIAEVQPHLRGFFVDDEAQLWVMRAGPSELTPVDVYERDGALVATGALAVDAEPRPRMRNGTLIGVMRDELGVESVARFRVESRD